MSDDHRGEPGGEARGVIVRFDDLAALEVGLPGRVFLPVEIVRRLAFASSTLALGGASPLTLGLALVEGRLLTHVALGELRQDGPVVVCDRPELEPFALGVLEIVATGVFDASDEGVLGFGDPIPTLDVADLFERIEPGVWLTRSEGPHSSPPPPPVRIQRP